MSGSPEIPFSSSLFDADAKLLQIPFFGFAAEGVDLMSVQDRRVGDLKGSVVGNMVIDHLAGDGVQDDCHRFLVGEWKMLHRTGAGDAKGDVLVVGADYERARVVLPCLLAYRVEECFICGALSCVAP